MLLTFVLLQDEEFEERKEDAIILADFNLAVYFAIAKLRNLIYRQLFQIYCI